MNGNAFKYAFLEFVRTHGLIQSAQNLLVAVSGGVDSVVLLHLLRQWQPYFRIQIGVAHLNHCQRGEAADRDAEFVRRLSIAAGLPFYLESENVPQFVKQRGLSLEEGGRILRDAFLERVREREGYDAIATAHHLNDQAETVLMRMIGGAGVDGLAGIRLRRGTTVRPLLFAARSDIESYARAHHLEFCEDDSNRDTRFLRNRIRHKLLPVLSEEFGMTRLEPFLRNSLILQDWLREIDAQVAELTEKHTERLTQNKIRLEMSAYKRYFSGIQTKWVEHLIGQLSVGEHKLSYHQFQSFSRWVNAVSVNGPFWLNHELCVLRNPGSLVFETRPLRQDAVPIHMAVFPDQVLSFPELGLRMEISRVETPEVNLNTSPQVEYLDAERLSFPLVVRNWQPGDRFQPLGMTASKKVKDFLTDEKNRLLPKSQALVVENQGEIIYVVGSRISEAYKVNPISTHLIRIEIKIQ